MRGAGGKKKKATVTLEMMVRGARERQKRIDHVWSVISCPVFFLLFPAPFFFPLLVPFLGHLSSPLTSPLLSSLVLSFSLLLPLLHRTNDPNNCYLLLSKYVLHVRMGARIASR